MPDWKFRIMLPPCARIKIPCHFPAICNQQQSSFDVTPMLLLELSVNYCVNQLFFRLKLLENIWKRYILKGLASRMIRLYTGNSKWHKPPDQHANIISRFYHMRNNPIIILIELFLSARLWWLFVSSFSVSFNQDFYYSSIVRHRIRLNRTRLILLYYQDRHLAMWVVSESNWNPRLQVNV